MSHDPTHHRKQIEDRKPVCLLTAVHPERALSRALVQHLAQELPDLRFVLEPPLGELRAIWVCGYEQGRADIVADLRRGHPEAVLVVTGRGPVESWSAEVTGAGADFACAWPLPVGRLAALLSTSREDVRRRGRDATVAPSTPESGVRG